MLPRSGPGSGGHLTGERGRKGRKTQAGIKKDREGEAEKGESHRQTQNRLADKNQHVKIIRRAY